jgi:hypothetical protein
MGLPRPNRTKFGLSLREIAHFTGESLSAIKRQSIKDTDALRVKADAISSVQTPQEAVEYVNVPQLFAEFDKATRDIVSVYFACVRLGWNDAELRARLKPIFDIVRPYIEEPEG